MRWIVTLALSGCMASSSTTGAGQQVADAGVAPIPACRIPHSTGRAVSAPVDGGALWIFESLDGNPRSALLLDGDDPCALSASAPAFDLPSTTRLVPLSLVDVNGRLWLFHKQQTADPNGFLGWRDDGIGVGPRDSSTGLFGAERTLLWTADRPAFGSSALVHDGHVYAYGCAGYGFLRSHCFVARAAIDGISDESAYEYYEGGNRWIARVDDAWPMVEAGAPSIHFDATRARFVMLYVKPLGRELLVRTGLGPSGPWSTERVLGACELPNSNAFCDAPAMHVTTEMRVTYPVLEFNASGAPEDYFTRVSVVTLPSGLP